MMPMMAAELYAGRVQCAFCKCALPSRHAIRDHEVGCRDKQAFLDGYTRAHATACRRAYTAAWPSTSLRLVLDDDTTPAEPPAGRCPRCGEERLVEWDRALQKWTCAVCAHTWRRVGPV